MDQRQATRALKDIVAQEFVQSAQTPPYFRQSGAGWAGFFVAESAIGICFVPPDEMADTRRLIEETDSVVPMMVAPAGQLGAFNLRDGLNVLTHNRTSGGYSIALQPLTDAVVIDLTHTAERGTDRLYTYTVAFALVLGYRPGHAIDELTHRLRELFVPARHFWTKAGERP